MKKLALSLSSILSYIFTAPFAYAATPTPIPTGAEDPCAKTAEAFRAICRLGSVEGGIGQVLGNFVSLFFVIAAVVAVIYLIYGGIKWITSKGEKTEVESARNHIVAAITGLIVVFLAFFIINFVLGFLIQGFSITNIKLPSLTQPK
ncbi:MAG: hypothetical protein HY425_01105 [Candidatus Levybacteria bacterium]|nr:hypothetical protein [Candidatus Levybacteria bacterium]